MTFLEFVEKVLLEENRPLNIREIWDIGKEKGYANELRTKGLTPWRTIGAQLYCDIRDNKEDSKFFKLEGKQIFFLNILKDKVNIKEFEKSTKKSDNEEKFLEKDLHKFLSYFAHINFQIKTKTIFANKSIKNSKNYDKWRHPDIVGVYFPNWEEEILNISKDLGKFGIKLFSYELKREINNSNLRETYFQAVSNSSWANEGYLVASEVLEEDSFYDEFKRLNNSFGIGLIKISTDDPSDCRIIFQAKQRDEVDIETMNILSKINIDFKDLMKDIRDDYSNKRIRGEYDKVIAVEELYKKAHSN
jgi:hypothetical protein